MLMNKTKTHRKASNKVCLRNLSEEKTLCYFDFNRIHLIIGNNWLINSLVSVKRPTPIILVRACVYLIYNFILDFDNVMEWSLTMVKADQAFLHLQY